nr:hypothetical protein [Tanacetum cinerariifolium]
MDAVTAVALLSVLLCVSKSVESDWLLNDVNIRWNSFFSYLEIVEDQKDVGVGLCCLEHLLDLSERSFHYQKRLSKASVYLSKSKNIDRKTYMVMGCKANA